MYPKMTIHRFMKNKNHYLDSLNNLNSIFIISNNILVFTLKRLL